MSNSFKIIRNISDSITQDRPWLSVLIPAYEHPTGVIRILDRIYASQSAGIECIINDDSHTEAVQVAVYEHQLYKSGGISYKKNHPTLGAVSNWNSLLSLAVGEYFLLIHHDECPENDDFFSLLQDELDAHSLPDLLLLNCLLPTLGGRRLRQHMPLWIRKMLMATSPDHLLLHNTLGPPSVVVIRGSQVSYFNTSLKWLVDVEWMVRTLRLPGVRYVFSHNLSVVFIPHGGSSITATLRAEIPRLRVSEAKLIRDFYGALPVIRLLLPRSWIEQLTSILERTIWLALRIVVRSTGWIYGRKMPIWLIDRP